MQDMKSPHEKSITAVLGQGKFLADGALSQRTGSVTATGAYDALFPLRISAHPPTLPPLCHQDAAGDLPQNLSSREPKMEPGKTAKETENIATDSVTSNTVSQ